MYKFLASAAVIIAVVPAAKAADMQPRLMQPAPMVYAPLPPQWTGWYVGGNLGVGWSDQHANASIPFNNGNLFLTSADLNTNTNAGFVGGVQGGFNYQFAPAWVTGIEADIDFTSMRASGVVANQFASISASQHIEWLSSIRGRVGYLYWPNLMLYGTVGVAWAGIEDQATLSAFSASTSISRQHDKSGFVIGAGAEYAWSPQWTVRAEYLFYDFNGTTQTFGTFVPVSVHWSDLEVSVIRLGANYRF